MTPDDDRPRIGRRQVLAGAGAFATAAGGASIEGAEARVSPTTGGDVSGQASPITSTIASPPVAGYSYRHLYGFDFTPDPLSVGRAYGGSGVYTNAGGTNLWAGCDIPAGALVREIEWYVYNNTSGNVRALGRLWSASAGPLTTVVADVFIPASGAIQAAKAITTSATWGPYPTGTKLALAVATPSSAVQINGVRIGFSNGGAQAGIRNLPVKIYDTLASGGKFVAGETRVVTLSSLYCPAGTNAVVLRITTTAATANGTLKIFPANQATFDLGAMTFIRALESIGEATVAITPFRQIKITASQTVHVRLDLVGTFS